GHPDVAEHPRGPGVVPAPRDDREGAGVRLHDHVGLVDPRETLDRAAVEADPLGERLLELSGRHGDRLQRTQHIGEPEPDEPDVALLDGPEDILLLTIHGLILPYAVCPPSTERAGRCVVTP